MISVLTEEPNENELVRKVSVSWADFYLSVEEIPAASDFIGLVEITGIKGYEMIETGMEERFGGLWSTIYSAKVLDNVASDSDRSLK